MSLLSYLMVLKPISPDCGIWASLMLFHTQRLQSSLKGPIIIFSFNQEFNIFGSSFQWNRLSGILLIIEYVFALQGENLLNINLTKGL